MIDESFEVRLSHIDNINENSIYLHVKHMNLEDFHDWLGTNCLKMKMLCSVTLQAVKICSATVNSDNEWNLL